MAYTRQYGDAWRAFYKNADGTISSSRKDDSGNPFKSERAARKWAEEQEIKARLDLLPKAIEEITVGEWFKRWWPTLDLNIKSRQNYAHIFSAHVLPEWEHRNLRDITASEINAWEKRMIDAGYARDGTAAAARARLTPLLGDAVIEGLIPSNPALRQRNRGRRTGAGTAGRSAERAWTTPLQALLLAERLAILSGRDDDFVLGVTLAWTGLRWGEAMGLQPKYVRLNEIHLDQQRIRVDHQLLEVRGKFYLTPPKDDSHRTIDVPPFLASLLQRQLITRAEQRCACEPVTIEGQREQPCQGKGRWVFLGEKGGHHRNSNYARRLIDPAADGWYPEEKNKKRVTRPARPVLVDASATWPGRILPAWPAAKEGEPYEEPWLVVDPEDDDALVPVPRRYQGRPSGLPVNAASGREDLVAFAIQRGVSVEVARAMTRSQILERFVYATYTTRSAPLACWLPVSKGLSPHGLRRGHATWLADLGVDEKLRDTRMGHAAEASMRNRYTQISPEARARLTAGLQGLWEEALAARAAFGVHSPVAVLDGLLEPFRSGRKAPAPLESSSGTVLDLNAKLAHVSS